MSYDLDESVKVDLRDGVLELILNRPEARNAINHPMQLAIDAALDEAELDDEVRSVLIRGEGKVFSAGHDLKEMFDEDYKGPLFPEEGFPVQKPSAGLFMQRAWYFRKPLICAVHGYSGPGATALVCCADFNIAAEGTRFGFEVMRKGGSAPSWFWLPMYMQLPMRVMEKLFLMGGWMDAAEALQFQFVQRVVSEADVFAEGRRWAEQTALQAPEHFAHAKHQMRRSYEVMGLAALHTVLAPTGPPRGDGDRIETVVSGQGMGAALAWRDNGIDDSISRV